MLMTINGRVSDPPHSVVRPLSRTGAYRAGIFASRYERLHKISDLAHGYCRASERTSPEQHGCCEHGASDKKPTRIFLAITTGDRAAEYLQAPGAHDVGRKVLDVVGGHGRSWIQGSTQLMAILIRVLADVYLEGVHGGSQLHLRSRRPNSPISLDFRWPAVGASGGRAPIPTSTAAISVAD